MISRRFLLSVLAGPLAAKAADWPGFRGDGSNLAGPGAWPLQWSADSGVAWRLALPGYGQSSPVIQDSRIYLTSGEGPFKEKLFTCAVDADSGKLLWKQDLAPAQPLEDTDMFSKAAPSPAADASGVYVFFETGDLAAYDPEGKLRWHRKLSKEYGQFQGRHGLGSSLRLSKAGLLVLFAHEGPSYLLCVDPETGQNRWKTERVEAATWSTPTILEAAGQEIALVAGGKRLDAYATSDGALLWSMEGLDGLFIPSPTPWPGGALVGSSESGYTMAIDFPDAADEQPEVAWKAPRSGAYFNSPLLLKDRAYFINRAGVAFCLDADSGEELWAQRIDGEHWVSPVGAGDRIYFFNVKGVATVVAAGDDYRELAKNDLGETGERLYGVAAVDEAFYLRYGRELIRIG